MEKTSPRPDLPLFLTAFLQRGKEGIETHAASREGAGFRVSITASRCPKPRRGETVAPAPVGVPVGQGVTRRRSANPARSVSPGVFFAPSGGLLLFFLQKK